MYQVDMYSYGPGHFIIYIVVRVGDAPPTLGQNSLLRTQCWSRID